MRCGEPEQKYKQLMSTRKRMFGSMLLFALGGVLGISVLDDSGIFAAIPGAVASTYFCLRFQQLRSCPWCSSDFFVERNSLWTSAIGGKLWHSRTSCAGCGMPASGGGGGYGT